MWSSEEYAFERNTLEEEGRKVVSFLVIHVLYMLSEGSCNFTEYFIGNHALGEN